MAPCPPRPLNDVRSGAFEKRVRAGATRRPQKPADKEPKLDFRSGQAGNVKSRRVLHFALLQSTVAQR